jgi:8-oxo-dGTP pyrophosphatase MutT (NUDIX family)
MDNQSQPWKVRHRFLELHSNWMTLVGEHLQDHRGKTLEYWRIEKADSVIVLPIQENRNTSTAHYFIPIPIPTYRPGVGAMTLDFPGGRVSPGQTPEAAALGVLKRELGIEAHAIAQLLPLNSTGWLVNSSFSNQKLYGYVAYLHAPEELNSDFLTTTYPLTREGIGQLLAKLTCLQCRAVFQEWWWQSGEQWLATLNLDRDETPTFSSYP